ncbi:MAG: 2-C-methyl-D-erythritol 4-phosphate cytidylyltransferase [Patescibacteria group bacterium]|jgi:2-C-methyl-D-erythritol 4-phosphate cytidylyltransferase
MVYAIILAAGKSKRFGSNKLLVLYNNRPVIYITLEKFQNNPNIDEIIIVANEEMKSSLKNIKKIFPKIKKVVLGGNLRQESVYNGLISIKNADDSDVLIIHNGANPFIDKKTIDKCIAQTKKIGAVVTGFPVIDTIKSIDSKKYTSNITDRKNLWHIQTPQVFKYQIIKKAYENAKTNNIIATDDSTLVEEIGYKVKIVKCSRNNIKITYKYDLS